MDVSNFLWSLNALCVHPQKRPVGVLSPLPRPENLLKTSTGFVQRLWVCGLSHREYIEVFAPSLMLNNNHWLRPTLNTAEVFLTEDDDSVVVAGCLCLYG